MIGRQVGRWTRSTALAALAAACLSVVTVGAPLGAPAAAADQLTTQYAIGTLALTGIACPSPGSCLAIGQKITGYTSEGTDLKGATIVAPDQSSLLPAVVNINNGTPGSIQTIPGQGSSSNLTAIACGSASACIAVGNTTASGEMHHLIVPITNGTVGQPAVGATGSLATLSCPTASTCFATDQLAQVVTITNGTETSTQPAPGGGVDHLSCPVGSTTCVGVGSTVDAATGDITPGVWSVNNGTPGAFQAVPSLSGGWWSVSCPSLQNCYATAADGSPSANPFLLPLPNGTPGTPRSIPLSPEDATGSIEVGLQIGCAAQAVCLIASQQGQELALINGAMKPAQTIPDNAYLIGVTCPSTTCYGAGQGNTPAAIPPGDSPASDSTAGAAVTIVVDTSQPPPAACTPGPTAPAPTGSVVRLAGGDRDGTSIAVSQAGFPQDGSAQAVVLASDAAYPDALAGTPLAVAKHGPLLLTYPTEVNPSVEEEIVRVLPKGDTVYLLGGDAALDPSIDADLQQFGYTTQRVAGPDRFATAVAIARALGDPHTALEATGVNFPDALSAGAAAAKSSGAVLLTNGASQASATSSYLSAHPGDTRMAVGGPAALADPGATPLVGTDRFGTAVKVAQQFFPNPTMVGFASAFAFPDALSGGANIGMAGGPMLLVPPCGALPSSLTGYLSSVHASVTGGSLYGGPSAVGDDVLSQLEQAA